MTKTRAAYYLLLIALLMPALPDGNTTGSKALHARTAALEEVADGKFCTGQEGLCGATSYLLRKFEAKAKYPLQVLSNWSNRTNVKLTEHRA